MRGGKDATVAVFLLLWTDPRMPFPQKHTTFRITYRFFQASPGVHHAPRSRSMSSGSWYVRNA